MEKTLAILKPDCVRRKLIGNSIRFIEENGFSIRSIKTVKMDQKEAENFYAIHKDKSFFEGLIRFMTSGPCVPMVLEKEDAVQAFRNCIGNTDPSKAAEGTLRRLYASNVQENIVHGSDLEENAKKEIAFFFPTIEIIE
ncbi:MAG: nucleoside-diphosphate kinase [Candidatus Marinimicrobia bacterium CG08_land_8_20_14_0_20_45_22]|nr:MAG: nucleoside-diphosphate kinase [Candidatus Marinimicrobia bacterium CG08_land_8_20_14_0_20_45_22]